MADQLARIGGSFLIPINDRSVVRTALPSVGHDEGQDPAATVADLAVGSDGASLMAGPKSIQAYLEATLGSAPPAEEAVTLPIAEGSQTVPVNDA